MSKGILVRRMLLFAAIGFVGLAVDLATKSWIFAKLGLPGGDTWWIWPRYFGFQTSLNQGALFGIGQGKAWLFAVVGVVFSGVIFYWLFVVGAATSRGLTCALGGIWGGILGNLYDRLGLWWTEAALGYPKYAVRDWILFQYQDWIWPNFNVADMLLVCGAAFLVLHSWLTSPLETEAIK